MPQIVTIPLDQPVQRGDTTIPALKLRKPGPGDFRGLKLRDVVEADTDAMIALLPRITEPPLTEIEVAALDIADFVECANQVAGFLPQRGASTASPTK